MFTVRNAVVVSIVVLVAALLLGVLSLAGPPDSKGLATDSYGTRWHGLRATYELLAELGVPVDRRLGPPTPDLPTPTTLVLWLPAADVVSGEPVYIERLLPWVEQGGRIVVAPASPDVSSFKSRLKTKSTDVLTALGLNDVQFAGLGVLEVAAQGEIENPFDEDVDRTSTRRGRIRRGAEQAWKDARNPRAIPFEIITPRATGTLKDALADVKQLVVPSESTSGLAFNDSLESASGLVRCTDADKKDRILAASFSRGKGEIVVVAESSLLMNVKLAQADNAVFVYDLLTLGGTRGVVFDEFYHGLSVRGNPLWLLTQSRYALFTVVGIALIGLVILRRGLLLGPPLEAMAKSRRTLLEYVEAMSRFFQRDRASTPFLVTEVRSGALRLLADRYNLASDEHAPDAIAQAIGRRSPTDAERFRQALQAIDAAQALGRSCSHTDALRAIQGISRCL